MHSYNPCMAQPNKARGARIKRLRKEAGKTVQQVATRADVTPQAVYQWEAGKTISPENVSKLATIFRVPTSAIYDGDTSQGVRPRLQIASMLRPKISLDRIRSVPFDSVMAELNEAEDFVAAQFPTGEKSLAFELVDESNSPEFREGDVIVIDPDKSPIPGDYVLAQIDNDEYVFRRYRKRDFSFSLVPENPDWPTLHSDKSQIHICGVMTEHTQPARR